MSTENRCSLLVLCLGEGQLYPSRKHPIPHNSEAVRRINYSNKREQSGDTNQPISRANLPLGKIPKPRRNSQNPDIDPVGLMEHPVRGENFIRGGRLPSTLMRKGLCVRKWAL